MAAELAEDHAGGREAAALGQPLEALDADHDDSGRAGAGRMERPCEAVEKGEARWETGCRIDLSRRLRLLADQVEPARDPLDLGLVTRDEGGLDGTPAAARREQAVLDGLGTRPAHPAAVERHDAVAVLGVDQGLNRAPDQRFARHAGQLRDERRGVQERPGRVMHGDERAHAGREQSEALLPWVGSEAAAVDSLEMPLWDAHAGVIGVWEATLRAGGPPASGTALAR
jgi:hypothetical protein